jgi:FkbM family methyltransferase
MIVLAGRVNYKHMDIKSIIKKIIVSEPNNFNLFLKVLDNIRSEDKEMNTMVELGGGGGYYSAFFNEYFNNKCKNIIVELCIQCWQVFGEKYFQDKENIYFYNNYIGEIIWACWGGQNNPEAINFKSKIKKISLNEVLLNSNTDYVDVLHMDVQGAEYFVLKEIIENNLIEKINYIFIMTHDFDNINYNSYLDLLSNNNLNDKILFNDPSYKENGDGLIIIRNKEL